MTDFSVKGKRLWNLKIIYCFSGDSETPIVDQYNLKNCALHMKTLDDVQWHVSNVYSGNQFISIRQNKSFTHVICSAEVYFSDKIITKYSEAKTCFLQVFYAESTQFLKSMSLSVLALFQVDCTYFKNRCDMIVLYSHSMECLYRYNCSTISCARWLFIERLFICAFDQEMQKCGKAIQFSIVIMNKIWTLERHTCILKIIQCLKREKNW